MDRIHVAILN